MKLIPLTVLVASVLLSSHNVFAQGNAQQTQAQTDSCPVISSELAPNADEIASLNLMREEEKLAYDVYQYLADAWQATIFSNIAQSEATHMQQVLCLLEAYGQPDPASEQAGVFNNADLQSLYDSLVARGATSLIEALKVGALVEETDIADLDNALGFVQTVEIKLVYENLKQGSENHLSAFIRQLTQQGETYVSELVETLETETTLTFNTSLTASFDFASLTLEIPELHIYFNGELDAAEEAYRVQLTMNPKSLFEFLNIERITPTLPTAIFDLADFSLKIPNLQLTVNNLPLLFGSRYQVELSLSAEDNTLELTSLVQAE